MSAPKNPRQLLKDKLDYYPELEGGEETETLLDDIIEAFKEFLLQNPLPTRHSHKWIVNNLDKAEVIEFDFRRFELWYKNLLGKLDEK